MIKLLKNFGKKEWGLVLICFILVIAQVWLELKMPDFMQKITVLVETEGNNLNEVLKNGKYMVLCALGSLISAIFVGYFAPSIAAIFSMKVRKKLFTKVENLSLNEIKEFSISSLITRTTNDITQIQMLIAMGLHLIIRSPITVIWAIIKIINKNLIWSRNSWSWSSFINECNNNTYDNSYTKI